MVKYSITLRLQSYEPPRYNIEITTIGHFRMEVIVLKSIFSYLSRYKITTYLAYFFTFFEIIADLAFPFILGILINKGVIMNDIETVIFWGSILFIIALFTFLAGILNSFYAAHTSTNIAYDLRQSLFEKIQSFSFTTLQKFPSSSLITRFTNDVRQIQTFLFMFLRILTKAPFLVIGGVVMSFVVNVQLALIFLITIPLFVFTLYLVLRRGRSGFTRVQGKLDNVNRVIQENISGMRVIKAYVTSHFEKKRFKQANDALMEETSSTLKFVESATPLLQFLINISLVVVLWFGHQQISLGSTSVGDVVAIVNYTLRISVIISVFTLLATTYSRSKASMNRVEQVLSEPSEEFFTSDTSSGKQLLQGAIQFDNVSFQYPNSPQSVLNNIDLSIKPREKIVILGATGSGKSTLFKLIPNLFSVTEGRLLLDEKPIDHLPLQELRQQIGYVSQTPLLFSGTIRENIEFARPDATEEALIQAAKDAQIHETIYAFPDGYDTLIGQRGVNLSGGQKQRISIARALIQQPRILLLDDSTSALDLQTERRLLDAVQTYDCTTLVITQKLATTRFADRIVIMEHGRITAIGTHEELNNSSRLYQQIVASQRDGGDNDVS